MIIAIRVYHRTLHSTENNNFSSIIFHSGGGRCSACCGCRPFLHVQGGEVWSFGVEFYFSPIRIVPHESDWGERWH